MPASPDDPDENLRWTVACISSGVDIDHDVKVLRSLTAAEATTARYSNELLASITSHESPHSRFESRMDQFDQAIADAITSMNDGVRYRPAPPLTQLFSETLAAFNGFLNQMPHWLKKQFGVGSAAVAVFRRACTVEYDRAFEYRLAYNLQNETRHRTDVLHVTYGKRYGASARVDAVVSDEILDHAINDNKWRALVRKELKSHARPIRAADLLVVLRGCVQRIYFQSLLAERPGIEEAIEIVKGLAKGVECAGDLALVAQGPPPPDLPSSKMTLRIQNLQLKAARLLQGALPQGERLNWPRFAIQVSREWLEQSASESLMRALGDDPIIHMAVINLVEPAGAFVGVTAPSAYAARSAVVRGIVRSEIQVHDQRTGPPTPLP
jgi:hypothetical protein